MAKLTIGDIIEIPTSKGFAYAQYINKREKWGAFIRVIQGTFKSRPSDFENLSKLRNQFVTFFPLNAAIRRKIFFIIGHADVLEEYKKFPIFRAAGMVTREGKVMDWWIIDGENMWRVDKLTDEQCKLPLNEIINDTALIHRIETGWTPENDCRLSK